MRTTIDIDDPILADLKRLQAEEGKSLGRLVSDLLAAAIPRRSQVLVPELTWKFSPGRLMVDLLDKEALFAALDREQVGQVEE